MKYLKNTDLYFQLHPDKLYKRAHLLPFGHIFKLYESCSTHNFSQIHHTMHSWEVENYTAARLDVVTSPFEQIWTYLMLNTKIQLHPSILGEL